MSHFIVATPDTLREFWRTPPEGNRTEDYAGVGPERSSFLVNLVNRLPRPSNILEIGCNCGRNLEALRKAGYTGLMGIDIQNCTNAVKEHFPGLASEGSFCWEPAEDVLPDMPSDSVDLIYSMVALTHIPPTQAEIVTRAMARIARQSIITIEDEYRGWPYHTGDWALRFFPRKYKDIFESLGFQQMIYYEGYEIDRDIDRWFTTRVFTRR